MNSYLLTIIELPDSAPGFPESVTASATPIKHLELRLPGPLDIPRIVAVLTEPPQKPRAPRKDRGVSRKGSAEPQLI